MGSYLVPSIDLKIASSSARAKPRINLVAAQGKRLAEGSMPAFTGSNQSSGG